MLHFDFKKSSRKCCESDTPFQPGEKFFSALVEVDDGETERRDYSEAHWNGPPEDCLGWWVSKVPEEGKKRVYWAPTNVMLAYFDHIRNQPAAADAAYVTALLLVQKKILVLEDDGGDESILNLRKRSDKSTYNVSVVEVSPQRLEAIQAELSERLFTDQPIGPEIEPDFDEPG